ncbi:ABC transporter ATP-binding protein [Candidatus Bathyarchaeota archaeon]|nr:MAG: ABC transporter ATP-binding protein [Candidatus Bathyarchaeota archaeon]
MEGYGLLTVDSINAYYGQLQALNNVSLHVEKGILKAIIGPNGAGKTTLMRAIMGLLKVRSGTITFMDKPIHELPTHRIVDLGIALVPEGKYVLPNMSVLENLLMGAYTKRARKKVDDTLEWVFQVFPRLKERKKQLAGTLSGGERQMLIIGRALMARPSLLLLDEPSLGLAPKLVIQTFKTLETILSEGITVILTEQNVYLALKHADEACVLESGRITLEGKGEELLNNEHVKKSYLGL